MDSNREKNLKFSQKNISWKKNNFHLSPSCSVSTMAPDHDKYESASKPPQTPNKINVNSNKLVSRYTLSILLEKN